VARRSIILFLSSACVVALGACGRSDVAGAAVRQSVGAAPVSLVPDRLEMVIGPDRSPLTKPISNLQPAIVRSLLDAGADPDLREGDDDDATSQPPLALAMGRPDVMSLDEAAARKEMVDLLLGHGADPNVRWCGRHDVPQCNNNTGITPLMYAAILGDEKLADALARHGADASLRDWRGLIASDFWGAKTKVSSWCATPRPNEPLVDDARRVVERKLWADDAEILAALRAPDRTIEVIRTEEVCEAAATAYARLRIHEAETAPRPVVPVLVVRLGQVWLVDDLRDRNLVSETGIFSKTWRVLAWGMTGS
jgi:hypothetical protein